MVLSASVGQAISTDGREAGEKAASIALRKRSREQIRFAWIFASHIFNVEEVVRGVRSRIDEVPFWGFSTSAELSPSGESEKSVVVALICGRKINPYANWWTDFGRDSQSIAQLINKTFGLSNRKAGPLFVAADGIAGDPEQFLASLNLINIRSLAGCLAGGNIQRGTTHQIGGRFSGAGGLSAAIFDESVKIGIGADHAWKPIGQRSEITRSEGFWIHSIDHRKPCEVYAELFGMPPRDWTKPPLNQLARLYPLEIELQPEQQAIRTIRSPLNIEPDGSLRMTASIPERSGVYFMVASLNSALEAVKRAGQQANEALHGTPPALGIILADRAYQLLFEGSAHILTTTIQEIIGPDIPILGGFTFGQMVKNPHHKQAEFLNQHIQIVLIGNS